MDLTNPFNFSKAAKVSPQGRSCKKVDVKVSEVDFSKKMLWHGMMGTSLENWRLVHLKITQLKSGKSFKSLAFIFGFQIFSFSLKLKGSPLKKGHSKKTSHLANHWFPGLFFLVLGRVIFLNIQGCRMSKFYVIFQRENLIASRLQMASANSPVASTRWRWDRRRDWKPWLFTVSSRERSHIPPRENTTQW